MYVYTHSYKQQLEFHMEQETGSKSGKEYIKAVYCILSVSLTVSIVSPSVCHEVMGPDAIILVF